ncbi:zinc finger protein 260-like [Saccostrea cucullata]|uniref:zinc finger protein 260-like n=1 Tax=Saccostrea cuccullata TaxID=36930 RepID=UPI002ED049F8
MSADYLTIAPTEEGQNQAIAAASVHQSDVPQGSQEIVIDGTPLQIPAGNYRTEVLEDGTVQVIVYQEPGNQTLNNTVTQPAAQPNPVILPMESEFKGRRSHDIGIQNTTVPHFNTYSFTEQGTQTIPTPDIDLEQELIQPELEDEDVEEEILTPLPGKRKRGRPPKAQVIHNLTVPNESNKFNKGTKVMSYHKCTICGKCYKNKANWTAHLKLHDKEEVFMCGFCGQIFQKTAFPQHLKTHKKEKESSNNENTAQSSVEANTASSSRNLTNTPLYHEPKQASPSKQTGVMKPAPNIPAKLDIKTGNLDRQKDVILQSHQVTLPNQQVATVIDLGSLGNLLTSGNNQNQLDLMNRDGDPENSLEGMEGENDDTKTKYIYKCNVCGKEYNNKSNCHRHLKTHTHEKTYKCPADGCDKIYMHRYELRMHMRIHTGEKPFKCAVCKRGFNEGGNLRRHMKIHAGDDTPFKCGVCFKGFSEMFRLQVHLKVHSGNIVCDTCGKKFGKISDLYRHIRIHTGDKPYKCDICGKAFCQKVNLQTHYRTHSGKTPFRCTLCNFGFSKKAILDNHMSGHEPEEIEEHEMNLRMMGVTEAVTIKQEPRTPAPPPVEDSEEEPQQMEVVTLDAKTGLVEVTLENQESETGLSQEELAQLVAATVEETEET